MKKTVASFLILTVFTYSVGKSTFFPSLRLLKDSEWNFLFFLPLWEQRLAAFFWIFLIGLGLLGWARAFQKILFEKMNKPIAVFLGMVISLALFSLYVFGLGTNEILYWPLTLLFFLPMVEAGWKQLKEYSFISGCIRGNGWVSWLLAFPIILWLFEYISPPIVWDAVLDHFRYAKEVSRLHQIPFHWTNHTGDMPKSAELILAGFWNLGGETLSVMSGGLAAVLMAWLFCLFAGEWNGKGKQGAWIFWSCPFFMAIFAWGYVEGFMTLFEITAVYCLWKALESPIEKNWLYVTAFILGCSFTVKYTAVFAIAACGIILIFGWMKKHSGLKPDWKCFLLFAIPITPWVLKNILANGNPVYPLATLIFGGPPEYNKLLEANLWADTGLPGGFSLRGVLKILGRVFFSAENSVNAAWTPLVFMALPWAFKPLKTRLGIFLATFAVVFFAGWVIFCTNFRHAGGGALVLALLAAMVWETAFKEKESGPRVAFAVGILLSIWLCLSAQITSTAPYVSALGFESNLEKLKRNYYYDWDTFAAYRQIEVNSDSRDKVLAFGFYQTYPLQRTAFVDFFWKRPIFLKWASSCRTAGELAARLRKEGVSYFLYQRNEAEFMSIKEKDFNLEGMPISEYELFWKCFMEPIFQGENTFVYKVRWTPASHPSPLLQLPGLQESRLVHIGKFTLNGGLQQQACQTALEWTVEYPNLALAWAKRADIEMFLGRPRKAIEYGKRAFGLGFQSLELYGMLVSYLEYEKQFHESELWKQRAQKRADWLREEKRKAIGFYQGFGLNISRD